MIELFFIYNNKFYPANTPVISPGNRSFRYGDGLFETMKITNGSIKNKQFHFERLFNGLSLLKFDVPKLLTSNFLEKKIIELAEKNNHTEMARVRLMLFRSNGGIFDPETLHPDYIIESWPLDSHQQLNENGLTIDIFPGARKSCDIFSNLKSNNYLPYVMAGLFAKKNKLNDCIILNSFERLCDSVIANIFIIKDEKIYTPPLSEGCVAGVTRRWMIEKFSLEPFKVLETEITIDNLLDADEFFLTNAIHQIKWVKEFRNKKYRNKNTQLIYDHVSNHLI